MAERLTPKERRALNSGHTMIVNTGSNNIGGVPIDFGSKSAISSSEYHRQADNFRAERAAAMRSEIKSSHQTSDRGSQQGHSDEPVSHEHVIRMWEALHPEAQTRKTGHSDAKYGGEYETSQKPQSVRQPDSGQQTSERIRARIRPHTTAGGGPTKRVGVALDPKEIKTAKNQATRRETSGHVSSGEIGRSNRPEGQKPDSVFRPRR